LDLFEWQEQEEVEHWAADRQLELELPLEAVKRHRKKAAWELRL